MFDTPFEHVHDQVHVFRDVLYVHVESLVVHVRVLSISEEQFCEVAELPVHEVANHLFDMWRACLYSRVVKVVDGVVETKVEDTL